MNLSRIAKFLGFKPTTPKETAERVIEAQHEAHWFKAWVEDYDATKEAVERYAGNPVDDPANREFMEDASDAWEELGNNGEPIKEYCEDDPRKDR